MFSCIFFLISSTGKMSKGSSEPVQAGQSSGSRSDQGSPTTFAAKPKSQGGLASVARLVKLGRCKNVVVVAGAGISTASGIPDFRFLYHEFFYSFILLYIVQCHNSVNMFS